MRGFLTFILICLLLLPQRADAFLFQKKDYKRIFINQALMAEKRKDTKTAFNSFEKAYFYYQKDKTVIETYAAFCERHQYFDKAEELYGRLYILNKDTKYLYKKDLVAVKNGKLSDAQVQKILNDKNIISFGKKDLSKALIFHYKHKQDWNRVKKTCDSLAKKDLGKDIIAICVAGSEKVGDNKNIIGYYLRYSDLYPKDSDIINTIIKYAENTGNYVLEEKYIKKLSAQNPKDNGIKYRLAGFYEKHNNWQMAAKVYEGLMISGDRSSHVTSSYNYVLSKINQKNQPKQQVIEPQKQVQKVEKPIIVYKPKPLTGFKLQEKMFYDALNAKDYSIALPHLQKMMQEQPNNTKLLKHRVDIAAAQNDYQNAIFYFEKIGKIRQFSNSDLEYLAFLYSKTGNYKKSLEIINNQLVKNADDKNLLNKALEYSMASEDWDNAILYNDKLLFFEPKNKKLLSNGINFYSIKKDFTNAIKYSEKLVNLYPQTEYKYDLANLYLANQEFSKAQDILEPMYFKDTSNQKIMKAYLNSLLAQQKTYDAYDVIRKQGLLNTKEGFSVLGDLAMLHERYDDAAFNYYKAYKLAPNDVFAENNLANAYRMLGHLRSAQMLYEDVLSKEADNKEAMLGIGSLEIDRKNFKHAREIFNMMLKKYPDYKPAKIAIVHSYIANDDNLSALDELSKMPKDEDVKLLEGSLFFKIGMPSDAKKAISNGNHNAIGGASDFASVTEGSGINAVAVEPGPENARWTTTNTLNGTVSKNADSLKYKIRKDQAINIIPVYSFFFQKLADEFRLNYQKYGIEMSKKTENNMNVFMDYNVYWYSSGNPNFLNNVTNEFRGGVQARPNKKWEYRADVGVKSFEFGNGAMLLTDSWIKHYFSDKFNLKLGIKRNNLEQSYLSAVGKMFNGVFTGRVADTRVYVEYEGKLPYQIYTYGRGVSGFMYGQNLKTNPYFEAMLGAGKLLYNNPRNKWINTFAADIVTFNTSYQYNLLNLYDNTGQLYGGYFSPSYFNATTLNLKMEGDIKPWHLKYGIKGFGGIQTSMSPDSTTPTWGFSPYISYDINDNVTINASYSHFTYADLQRDLFIINAVIRGFKKHENN